MYVWLKRIAIAFEKLLSVTFNRGDFWLMQFALAGIASRDDDRCINNFAELVFE